MNSALNPSSCYGTVVQQWYSGIIEKGSGTTLKSDKESVDNRLCTPSLLSFVWISRAHDGV